MFKQSKFKFIFKSPSILVIAALLCSCAKTEELPKTSEESQAEITNPFAESTNPTEDSTSEAEESTIPYGGAFMYDGSVKNGDIEYHGAYDDTADKDYNDYNGGTVTYYIERELKADGGGICYNDEGYLIFLDGILQKASYGTEESELIIIHQVSDTVEKITLNFTPTITEEMKDREIFTLRMVSVSGRAEQDETAVFSDLRLSVPIASDMKIKPTVPLKVMDEESAPSIMPIECEEIPIGQQNIYKYDIQDGMDADVLLVTKNGNWNSMFVLPEGESTAKADCIMYGYENYTGKYRVYFFQNNKPVKIAGGWDCVDMEVKEGYLTKCEVEFENVENRDEIFAIATPLDGSVRSSFTMSDNQLILSETDPYYVKFKNTDW